MFLPMLGWHAVEENIATLDASKTNALVAVPRAGIKVFAICVDLASTSPQLIQNVETAIVFRVLLVLIP